MKMISIEDLKRRIKEKFCNSCSTPYKDTDVIEMGEYCCDMVSDTIAFIDELPTIEAQPMKRGSIERLTNAERYEMFYKSRKDFDGKCSECGAFVFDTDKLCSMCGAVFHNGKDSDNDG